VYGGGSVVVVPSRIAALLVRHGGLARYHVENRGLDPELDDVLVALKVAAAAWAASVDGSDPRKPPEAEPFSAWLAPVEVADLLGLTDSRVRQEIRAGRLKAERVGRGWRVSRQDFEHYRAARAA
jgi:excisionase family DNA binding protein